MNSNIKKKCKNIVYKDIEKFVFILEFMIYRK